MNEKIMNKAEMTREQLDFLCGLIEKENPQKIVEIGIAAGGTSVVVIDKLEAMKSRAQMFSLDLSDRYYRDGRKSVGYLIDEYKKANSIHIEHKLLTGNYAPSFLESIGDGIDFLILDTVHSLPGEFLDFLAFYPYLSKNATVVVHDIILNHLGSSTSNYATQMLLNCIVGEKLTPINRGKEYPGIGAVKLNEDTPKYIDDVFNALTITWRYLPMDKELSLYQQKYTQFYDERQLFIFNEAIKHNKKTFEKRINKNKNIITSGCIAFGKFIKQLENKRVYIFGNGMFGKEFKEILEELGICVKGNVVSVGNSNKEDVFLFSELLEEKVLEDKDSILLIGVGIMLQQEIVSLLISNDVKNYILPDKEILMLLDAFTYLD